MQHSYSYRIEVLRNGARVAELQAVNPPKITFNAESTIKSGLSGEFKYSPELDPINDEIKAWQIIDGEETPAGVFSVGVLVDNYADTVHTIKIEAYDRAFLLQSIRTENILHLSAGTNYIEVIKTLFAKAGISLYTATATTSTLATDREDWEMGTDYLTIINDLLGEINYSNIWFDANGYAKLLPVKNPDAGDIKRSYDSDTSVSLLSPACQSELDIYDKPNVYVVVCSNPDNDEPMTATAVNDNPLSSLSTLKRKRRIVQVLKVDNIADQKALQEYAQRLCNDSMLSSETVTIRTSPVDVSGLSDTVALYHPDITGIYQETAWSLTMQPGASMTHTLRRSVLI